MRKLSCLLALMFSGCQCQSNAGFEEWRQVIGDATTSFDSKRKEAQEAAVGELEKLVTFEYKVLELEKTRSSAELEESLAELGKDRWDCFHIDSVTLEKSLRVYCKRAPKTMLKFIPRVF
jgi:hypothetical protein